MLLTPAVIVLAMQVQTVWAGVYTELERDRSEQPVQPDESIHAG